MLLCILRTLFHLSRNGNSKHSNSWTEQPSEYGQFCADLFNNFAEKLVGNCSEEWSMKHLGVAAHALEWALPSNLSCQGKSSLRKAVNQITCSFFTVVSRSHTLKDRLCPLGMGSPQIQYSMYYNRRVPGGFFFFPCLSYHDLLTSLLYVIPFWVSRMSENARKMAWIDIMLFLWECFRSKIINAILTLFTPK